MTGALGSMVIATLSPTEIVRGALYVSVLVAAAVATGRALAVWLGGDGLDRALLVALGSLLQPTLTGLVLGAGGLLSPVPTLVVSAAMGGAALLLSRRHRVHDAPPVTPGSALTAAVLLASGLGAALGVVAIGVGFRDGPSQHHETKHYHFSAMAEFETGHSIWGTPFQNPAVFTASHPSDAEVLDAEVAFATGGDYLAYGWLLPVSGLLGVLAAAAMTREAGGRPAVGALAAMATLVSPLGFNVARSLANDLLPIAAVAAGVALILRSRREGSTGALLLAGAALGFALGTKYTAAFPVAILAVACAVLLSSRRALLLLPGLGVFAGPWFLRNLITFDNPLYPQPVRVAGIELFEGGHGPLDPYSGTFAGHLLHARGDALSTWVDLVRPLFGPLLVAAVIGVGAGLWVAWRRKRPVLFAVAALTAVGFVGYAVTPYTGGGNPPALTVMGSNLRYLLFAVFIGLVVLCASLRPPLDLAVGTALCAWSVWQLFDRPVRPDVELSLLS